MKKIILTFDYEVFLGKSGSIKNCIINPTEKILKLFEREGIKGVFFIDVLFLKRLKEENLTEDYELVKKNIQSILKSGSFVELHIHTHWLDAEYDRTKNEWDLTNYKRYKFNTIKEEERSRIFQECIYILESICREVTPSYKLSAFRAGGLCIQPFDVFEKNLRDNDIFIESSVAVGLKSHFTYREFDFTKVVHRNPYRFKNDPIKLQKDGEFVQYPLLTYKISFLCKLNQKLKGRSAQNVIFGDGKSVSSKGNEIKKSFFNRFKRSKHLFSLDGDFYQDILFQKLKKDKADTITLISHPKLMSETSLSFIKRLKDSNKITFSTFDKESI